MVTWVKLIPKVKVFFDREMQVKERRNVTASAVRLTPVFRHTVGRLEEMTQDALFIRFYRFLTVCCFLFTDDEETGGYIRNTGVSFADARVVACSHQRITYRRLHTMYPSGSFCFCIVDSDIRCEVWTCRLLYSNVRVFYFPFFVDRWRINEHWCQYNVVRRFPSRFSVHRSWHFRSLGQFDSNLRFWIALVMGRRRHCRLPAN